MTIYDDYWVSTDGPPRVPALGAKNREVNIRECILVAGSTAAVPAAASDTDADIFIDSQEVLAVFNVEGGSDSDGPGEGVWIMNVLPVIQVGFTAAVVMNLGDAADTDGWCADTVMDATATDQGIAHGVDTNGMPWNMAGGKFYSSSGGVVNLGISGADPVVGRLAVYATYFRCARAGGYN